VKHWGLLALILAASSLARAADQVTLGCKRIKLVLDAQLTPSELERQWASGESVASSPAVLELHGCQGQLLDRITLQAPLAKLDPAPLRGTRLPTVLVSVDLTAPAGSYNGPLTTPVEVDHNRLQAAKVHAPDGTLEPIALPLTGKASWKRVRVGGTDQLLSVRCEPKGGHFVTTYRRYIPGRQGWRQRARSEPGLWESDGAFPTLRSFP
jgi:hypothetical protein